MIDIIDTQNTIIKMQSDIIDKLFLLLMQYMTVEEADGLDIVKKINEVARVRKEGIKDDEGKYLFFLNPVRE